MLSCVTRALQMVPVVARVAEALLPVTCVPAAHSQ